MKFAISIFQANRDSILAFAAMSAERVLQMFVGLYVAGSIARGFSPAEFAAWQIAYSIFIVSGAVCDVANERVALPRLCAAGPQEYPVLWNSMLVTKFLGGAVSTVLLIGWAASLGQPEVIALAVLWSVYLLIGEPVSLAVFELYAKENFARPQLFRMAATVVRLAVIVAAVQLHAGLIWIATAWTMEIVFLLLVFCVGWIPERRIRLHLTDWALVKSIALQGTTLAIAAAASVALTRVDRLALGATIPTAVLAQYVASMNILEAAFAFSTTLLTVVGAKVLFKPGPIPVARHAQLTALAAGISVLAACFISLVALPLVTWIFGQGYAESAHYLRSGAWLLPFVFIQGILQAPLLMRSSKRFFLVKSCAALGGGVIATSLAALHGHYDLIISGAYLGFAMLIGIDIVELRRRSGEIYDPVRTMPALS